MKNFFQKIINNPLLSFVVWMILLMTRLIIKGDFWGTIVELGGALIFIASLVNWSKNKKASKSKGAETNDLKK